VSSAAVNGRPAAMPTPSTVKKLPDTSSAAAVSTGEPTPADGAAGVRPPSAPAVGPPRAPGMGAPGALGAPEAGSPAAAVPGSGRTTAVNSPVTPITPEHTAADSCRRRKAGKEKSGTGLPATFLDSTASRSASATGKPLSSKASTTLKMALLVPMPKASESSATAVKPGLLRSIRQA